MLNRHACERRVYRFASLLTGNPHAAIGVIESVIDAQPDLRRPDSAHLDRLTVLRSREIRPGRIDDAALGPAVAAALSALSAQQREAWVLRHVYRSPFRETARAMDCSITATRRHLKRAEESMNATLADDASPAGAALLRYSLSLDVPTFYHRRRMRRARLRQLMLLVATLLALGAFLAAAWLLKDLVAADPPHPPTGDGNAAGGRLYRVAELRPNR